MSEQLEESIRTRTEEVVSSTVVKPMTKTTKPKTTKVKKKISASLAKPAEPIGITGDFCKDLDIKPIYDKDDSVEEMGDKTKNFTVSTLRRGISTAVREEENYLQELVDREYYPLEMAEDFVPDDEKMRDNLNLI